MTPTALYSSKQSGFDESFTFRLWPNTPAQWISRVIVNLSLVKLLWAATQQL
jgi:antibiotic biosynthesis monooxygenase (ABM) superfamily enzyme